MSDSITTFEEVLEKDGKLVYRCRGTSMMPMLRQHRDLVVIRPDPQKDYGKYDVVLYRRGEKYILHRILKAKENGYVICGDHNWNLERDITNDQILGRLTSFVRDGREIRVEDVSYRIYVHLWCDLFPLRAGIRFGKVKSAAMLRRIIRFTGINKARSQKVE